MGNGTEYYKQAKRNQREAAKQLKAEGGVKRNSDKIEFIGKKINIKKFEEAYKDKVKDSATKYYTYKNILDIVPLITASKEFIEKKGAYIVGTTGTVKANPAQKELRENIKAFTGLLKELDNMIGTDDKADINSWLDDDEDD